LAGAMQVCLYQTGQRVRRRVSMADGLAGAMQEPPL